MSRPVGFSVLGLIVSLAVLSPNLLLLWFPPRDVALQTRRRPPAALVWLERLGQALCVVVPVVTLPGRMTWWAIVPTALALIGYYALWARYLTTGRRLAALYQPCWRIPVPMAVAPVLVFLGSAAWLGNPWMALSAVILAAAHLPASMLVRRAMMTREDVEPRLPVR